MITDRDETTRSAPILRHEGWSRAMFAISAVVRQPCRFIFLAGVGAEVGDEEVDIAYPGDFAAQCRLAYDTVGKRLRAEGADFHNVVRIVAYVTDMRHIDDYFRVQGELLDGAPRPPHTLIAVQSLADPRMMVEIEITAALAQ